MDSTAGGCDWKRSGDFVLVMALRLIRHNQESSLSQCRWQTDWLKPDCCTLRWDCNWWPLAAPSGQADQPPAIIAADAKSDCDTQSPDGELSCESRLQRNERHMALRDKENDVFFEKIGPQETTTYGTKWFNVDGKSFQVSMESAWYWAYHHDFTGHGALELLALAYEAIGQQFGAWMWISDPTGNCVGGNDYLEVEVWDVVIDKIREALANRLQVTEDEAGEFLLDYLADDIASRQAILTLLASGRYEALRRFFGWFMDCEWSKALPDAIEHPPLRYYPGQLFQLPSRSPNFEDTCPADEDHDDGDVE